MIKVLFRASLVLLVFHVSFTHSRPQLGSLLKGSSGFLGDIVRANVDEDSKRGKLAILIAENGGDADKVKDSIKRRIKAKVPFLLSDEEKAEEEERIREEERRREEEEEDSSLSSRLFNRAKDKVKKKIKSKLPFGSDQKEEDEDDESSFFGSLFD